MRPRERPEATGASRPWVAVVGARPNFVKLAPLVAAARAVGRDLAWIHTGQHVLPAMSAAMARDLGLPTPLVRLDAPAPGPGRVARMAAALRAPLASLRPSLVVVLGDVDSTVAAAEAASRVGVEVAHVEAGLRSFERTLPEERNRVRVDRLSAILHTTEPSGAANLRREGFPPRAVRRSGNVMADALEAVRGAVDDQRSRRSRRRASPYVVATLHRQANVDDARRLARFAEALEEVAKETRVVFPVHPRTASRLGGAGRRRLARGGVEVAPPLPYVAFLALVADAAAVVTDSGGLAVETSLLGVPCVTARRRTEHLLTLSHGTNRLAGPDPRRVPEAVREALRAPRSDGRRLPRDWDGRAAERIVADWLRITM